MKSVAQAGVELVINLAPHDVPNAILDEPELVEALGMDYLNIPVNWNTPTRDGLDFFMDAMDCNRDKSILVHCEANFRASAFITIYRILRLDWDPEEAFEVMHTIWDEDAFPVWRMVIEDAKLTGDNSQFSANEQKQHGYHIDIAKEIRQMDVYHLPDQGTAI